MTKPELDALTTAVHALEASFHVLQICPPSRRKRTPTIGRHREQFATIALEAGRQFEALMPRELDMQEVAAIRHERLHLQALRQKVRHLNALLDGHLHAVGHADYQNCTRIYRMLRAATHVEDHDLDGTLDALGKAYSEKRTTQEVETKRLDQNASGEDPEPPGKAGPPNQDPAIVPTPTAKQPQAAESPHPVDSPSSALISTNNNAVFIVLDAPATITNQVGGIISTNSGVTGALIVEGSGSIFPNAGIINGSVVLVGPTANRVTLTDTGMINGSLFIDDDPMTTVTLDGSANQYSTSNWVPRCGRRRHQ